MGKLSKLIKSPGKFLRDSKMYRRYVTDGGGEKEERRPVTEERRHGDGPPKEKTHPLPTVALSEETLLSEADLARIAGDRQFFRFEAAPAVRARVIDHLADAIRAFMTGVGFADRDWASDIRDFIGTYERNPAAGAARTTAEGSLLWLFVLARAIAPRVIVESGVFKGASLFTLRSAVPGATLYGYEPDLSNLMVRDGTIRLHAGDWSEAPPRAEGPDDLCYFDDHISNCLRVRQAYDLGFRHLVFDDSPDIGQLHRWRFPGVPTIQMVVHRRLEPGEWVEWVWKNRRHRYVHREEDTHGARDLVEEMHELPSLSSLTGRTTGVQTYVRLKRRDG